jgi:DNA-binding CsgD family transcriptional regulator
MSKSRRLGLRDVREIYRLVGECRELGADTRAWLGHALEKMRKLTHAQLSLGGEIRPVRPDRGPNMLETLATDWPSAASREHFYRLMEYGMSHPEPLFQVFAPPDGRLATRSRKSLVSDRDWYGSFVFNEFHKPAGIDDTVMSLHRLPGGHLHDIGFCRAVGEPHFSWRERRLIHLFHVELGPQIGVTLARNGEPSVSNLAPRLRRTLECLLEGDGEKQAATRLGLSRSTVHEYVTLLYDHFQISSRGELLAHFLRRGWRVQDGSPPPS